MMCPRSRTHEDAYEFGLAPHAAEAPSKACAFDAGSDPKDARGYYMRALWYQAGGDRARAIDDYSAAISLDPKFSWAYLHRARAYGETGDRKRQVKDLKAAAALGLAAAIDMLTSYKVSGR